MAEKIKAILIGVNSKTLEDDFEYLMEELKGLAAACNIEVVGEITQNLNQINNNHYMGIGKIEELAVLADFIKADLVIANDELSFSQVRMLEDKLNVKVIDRSMLILDIFARRAKTREAKLQVEVARLQYMLPRLVGQKNYDRQGGGAGLINRGSGEGKLELDRRKIEDKIAILKKELEVLALQREIQRNRRKKNGIPVVSLVGYTNAGKSTIMNRMVEMFNLSKDKQVFEKNMLFATLETSVRKIELSGNKSFLLTDTVGFINKLPHHFVKAFRSTLEELAQADLIIHVVDYSDPQYRTFIEVTDKTLEKIGVNNIPIIYALNKADLTNLEIPRIINGRIYLSAKEKIGINELTQLINDHIFKDYLKCKMLIPYEEGQIISYFHENGSVLTTSYEKEGIKLTVECKESDYEKYRDYVIINSL
jgi:GTPase